MSEKIIFIATMFTGFNYGSSLQAYALKQVVKDLGYTPYLIKLTGGIKRGRDVRVRKLSKMILRMILHPLVALKSVKAYKNSFSNVVNSETKKLFLHFEDENLSPLLIKWSKLKKDTYNDNVAACICGSDQIWNSVSLYVDPLYYLRFAPNFKRISYAPSFGRIKVANYNFKKIKKWISEIPYLSVRELSGKILIDEMINRTAQVVLDPTLLLTKEEWIDKESDLDDLGDYLFVYFLSPPSKNTKELVLNIAKNNSWKICSQSQFEYWHDCSDIILDGGPLEFITLMHNAQFVCTDSFHGTAFAINFNVPFFVFERNYGAVGKQSTRIESLLNITRTEDRFIKDNLKMNDCDLTMNFSYANLKLQEERCASINYLKKAIDDINIKRDGELSE